MTIFTDDILPDAELYARNAVLDAGIAAMRYYREAFRHATALGSEANASTEADIQATVAAVRSLGGVFHQIDPDYRVYGEELDSDYSKLAVRERMDAEIPLLNNADNIIRGGQAFIDSFPRRACILIDAIDGTTNFRAGLPIFCSALAIFLDGHLRVGAIYDPIHHVVYYGSTPEHQPARAHIWHVSSGDNTRLKAPKGDGDLLIASHLTRSDETKRRSMIGKLDRLVAESGGHYQLNSGQLQLAFVAGGNLSGFANNSTNAWDVAAGHVLVDAVGGKVTHFDGSKIDYHQPGKVEVVAGGTPSIHERLIELLA